MNKRQLALSLQVLIGASAAGNAEIIKFILYEKIARLLVQLGTNVNAKDCCGERPLMKTLCSGRLQLAKFLLESGADINVVHKKALETVLTGAAVRGDIRVITVIAQSGVLAAIIRQYGSSAFITAVSEGLLEIVKLLVDAGADVKCVSSESKTVVMLASYVAVVKFLVGKGSGVNFVPGHNQWSPLLYASCNGHVKIVKCLIQAGADVNFIRTEDHSTPLMLTASNGQSNIVEILVRKGAN